jgi:hypothetical protein
MKRVHVRPRAGLLIRHPFTRLPLPLEGCEVDADAHGQPLEPYWLRRQADVDVEVVEHVEPAAEPADAEE